MAEERKITQDHRPKQSKKGIWSRIWHFLWHEDSVLSWIVNVILVFLIIKFILYPGIGMLTGTKFPVVAVVSTSMEHNQPFDQWWTIQQNFYQNWGITKEDFKNYSFPNGFNKGDIIFLVGKKPTDIKVGDVIVFQSQKPYPIIHRVIETTPSKSKFQTKGDNNIIQIVALDLNEQNVQYSQLLGKAVFRIPYLGYVKIFFVDAMQKMGIAIKG